LTNWTRARWVLLAFVPSSLVLGVTTYLTTNIAPAPLMWIVPLALYLLTFILVFSRLPAWVHWALVAALPVAAICLAWVMFEKLDPHRIRETIVLNLITFFLAAMVCHGELANSRPAPRHLTEFYWWIAVGGVLGGMFNAFVAPVVFTTLIEYPLAIVLALMSAPPLPLKTRDGWSRQLNRATPYLLAAVAGAIFWFQYQHQNDSTMIVKYRERNFFGILTVKEEPASRLTALDHGNICHGLQFDNPDPRARRAPLTYFYWNGPIGQVFTCFQGPTAKRTVAVIGLGAGSLAGYADNGQTFTFYELDPAVPPVAEDPRYFTFLRDARQRGAVVNIVLGDARISMQSAAAGEYELIVLDAFSGDAIPVHLLTREAMELYLDKLKDGGLLALHITNGYLDLEPVIADLASSLKLAGRIQAEVEISADDAARCKVASTWVVLARQESDLSRLANDPRWRSLKGRTPPSLWTDDYSNVFSVFR
jgi:spermidine synthase